jgi:CubicO group peptidase (beta-lactamase class C family)
MKRFFTSLLLLALSFSSFAQSLVDKIDTLMMNHVREAKFNGVVLVAQKGKVLVEKGYGFKNWEEKTLNDKSTVFQIGSVTKQVTAAVIMQLQQEGKLSVQDKIWKYFPQFPNGDKITIEHLLTHTSGIFNYTNDTVLMRSDVTKPRSEAEMIASFQNRPLNFEPGSNWDYSNSGYSLLGYIIAKVEKKGYEQVVRERILRPLGMSNSGFDFTHLSTPAKAQGYFTLTPTSAFKAPIVDSTIAYAAGALYSTAGDLYKWERSISLGKILSPESWKKTFTPVRNNYGYGWTIDSVFGRRLIAHSGGIHGFSSYLLRFPEDDVAIIFLSNSSARGLGKMGNTIGAILFGKPYELAASATEVKLDTAVMRQYVGDYQLAPGFNIQVTLKDGQLFGQGTGQPPFQMFPRSSSRFFLKAVEAEVEFFKDTTGAVKEMILYQGGRELKGAKVQ